MGHLYTVLDGIDGGKHGKWDALVPGTEPCMLLGLVRVLHLLDRREENMVHTLFDQVDHVTMGHFNGKTELSGNDLCTFLCNLFIGPVRNNHPKTEFREKGLEKRHELKEHQSPWKTHGGCTRV